MRLVELEPRREDIDFFQVAEALGEGPGELPGIRFAKGDQGGSAQLSAGRNPHHGLAGRDAGIGKFDAPAGEQAHLESLDQSAAGLIELRHAGPAHHHPARFQEHSDSIHRPARIQVAEQRGDSRRPSHHAPERPVAGAGVRGCRKVRLPSEFTNTR